MSSTETEQNPAVPPEFYDLQADLATLNTTIVQQDLKVEQYRKSNAKLASGLAQKEPALQQTTQLLMLVCEQLVREKRRIAAANFMEHSSDLTIVCERFRTHVANGKTVAPPELSRQRKSFQLFRGGHRQSAPTIPQGRQSVDSAKPPAASGRRSVMQWVLGQEAGTFPFTCSWWPDVAMQMQHRFWAIRSGQATECRASDLYVGDVIYLSAGQVCPLDARVLVHSDGTQVDRSTFSSDSKGTRRVRVTVTCEHTSSHAVQSDNILLAGSNVTSGRVFCMVVRTSDLSFLGSGYAELREVDLSGMIRTMPANKCEATFKRLCVKARTVFRTYDAIQRFADCTTVIVSVTEQTTGYQSLIDACGVHGKELVLLPTGMSEGALASFVESVQLCAQEPQGTGRAGALRKSLFGTKSRNAMVVRLDEPKTDPMCPQTSNPSGGTSRTSTAAATPDHRQGDKQADAQNTLIRELASNLSSAAGPAVLIGASEAHVIQFFVALRMQSKQVSFATENMCFPILTLALVKFAQLRRSTPVSGSHSSLQGSMELRSALNVSMMSMMPSTGKGGIVQSIESMLGRSRSGVDPGQPSPHSTKRVPSDRPDQAARIRSLCAQSGTSTGESSQPPLSLISPEPGGASGDPCEQQRVNFNLENVTVPIDSGGVRSWGGTDLSMMSDFQPDKQSHSGVDSGMASPGGCFPQEEGGVTPVEGTSVQLLHQNHCAPAVWFSTGAHGLVSEGADAFLLDPRDLQHLGTCFAEVKAWNRARSRSSRVAPSPPSSG